MKLEPYSDFASASRAAMSLLHEQLGLGMWLVTRTSGQHWIVLEALNREPRYGVKAGDVLRWSDSFCARMVKGAPQIAATSANVEAYREAPILQSLPIGAYVGIPLCTSDGELFGTLCGVDPSSQEGRLEAAGPLLEVVGKLLATVLDRDLRLEALARRAELAETTAMVDELTGLWNRRAWEQVRAAEEARCRRYGHSAAVLSMDLDGLKIANDAQGHLAGDQLLRGAAHALKAAVRAQDIVARVGGDEFAVLLVECNEEQGRAVEDRLRATLTLDHVEASVGLAVRDPKKDLDDAWARADEAMYAEKRQRKVDPR